MHGGLGRTAEHHLELREAEDERVGAVEEHEVDAVTELVGQARGQLEAAEAGAEDDDPHQRWFSASSEAGSPAMRVCHIRRGCVMSNGVAAMHQPAVVPHHRVTDLPAGGSRCGAAGTPTR